jgi:hypothetical protein
MQKNESTVIALAAIAALIGLVAAPFMASATVTGTLPASAVGSWNVTTLAVDNGSKIESFKVDRDLVAWTELTTDGKSRLLYGFDGSRSVLLATMALSDWDADKSNTFYDYVEGNYDVRDGLIVWVGSDATDREIWSWDGYTTARVSDNTYDDRHPVTSRGKVAWTSQPDSAYNLMVKDSSGVRRLDSWQVMNYAWSGGNIYWLNMKAGENWFRVFVSDGKTVTAVGEADDRPIKEYFYVDGNGTAAWEYSTKKWDYDKRVVYLSYNGTAARRVIQRDVPPNITRVEDVEGGEILFNSRDLLTSLYTNTSLIRTSGWNEQYITRKTSMMKARFVGGKVVRHLVQDTSSALVFGGSEDYMSYDHIILDRWESDGDVVAGALLKGGVQLWFDGTVTQVASGNQASSVKVGQGTAAWVEKTASGTATLKCAQRTVLVRNGSTTRYVSGKLIKESGSPAVYVASSDGLIYAFPGEGQFRSWYSDFRSLRTYPKGSLTGLLKGGNVLYRPGSRLIKTASSPRVYKVAEGGVLQWVTSADIFLQVYGSEWNRKIDTIPDAQLADYAFGTSINDPNKYYMALR